MKGGVVRLSLVAAVAAMLFVAYAVWLRDGGDEPATATRNRLYELAQTDPVGLRVAGDGSEATFHLIDGAWVFASQPLVRVNDDRWGGIVLLLTGPETDRTIAADPAGLAEFGLNEPWRATIDTVNGDEVEVSLGDKTPDEQYYYAQVSGASGVHLVNAPWGDVLKRLVTDPPYPEWFWRVEAERVRAFEIATPGGTATFILPGEGVRVIEAGEARDATAGERALLTPLLPGPPGFAVVAAGGASEIRAEAPRATVRLSYELTEPLDDRTLAGVVYQIGPPNAAGTAYHAWVDGVDVLMLFDRRWIDDAVAFAAQFPVR